MPGIKERVHRTPRRRNIIRRHARKILKLHLVRPVRHQYAWHIDPGKFSLKIVGITAEEQ